MKIMEALREAWDSLTTGKKALLAVVIVILALMCCASAIGNLRAWGQIHSLEKDVTKNKKIAADALTRAGQIQLERLEAERKLAETEAKINAKSKETTDAELKTLNARDEYYRAIREHRTDDPSSEQLCSELAALGYSCTE